MVYFTCRTKPPRTYPHTLHTNHLPDTQFPTVITHHLIVRLALESGIQACVKFHNIFELCELCIDTKFCMQIINISINFAKILQYDAKLYAILKQSNKILRNLWIICIFCKIIWIIHIRIWMQNFEFHFLQQWTSKKISLSHMLAEIIILKFYFVSNFQKRSNRWRKILTKSCDFCWIHITNLVTLSPRWVTLLQPVTHEVPTMTCSLGSGLSTPQPTH